MQDIRGTADFHSRIGSRGADRTAKVKSDHHGFALHDSGHVCADVLCAFGAQNGLSQRTHFLAFIDNIKGLVNEARLVLRQIEMDGMTVFGKLSLFAFAQGYFLDLLDILFAAAGCGARF